MHRLAAFRKSRLKTLLLFACLVGLGLSSCTCQRKENIEAKERLSKPAPESPLDKRSRQTLSPSTLATDAAMMKRISEMRFGEIQRRLGSLKYHSKGRLTFARGPLDVDSREDTRIVSASRGDFSVITETADKSTQELCYINDIFFLKNRNGKWRASRDPSGERIAYLEDAAGIWRSFYKLFAHALDVTAAGEKSVGGRNVYVYKLNVPDQSAKARAEGAKVADAPTVQTADAGPDDEPAPEETKSERASRMDRVKKWRDRAQPAGGSGEMLVDGETGALMKVSFKGDLAVGDGPEPSVLHVEISTDVTEVGKDHVVEPPKEAVEEVTRKKWLTKPRKFLEDKGIVAPLPDPDEAAPKAEPPASKTK